MYHFFSEHEHIHDTYIDIVGSDVNHIKNVLRLKTGDSLLISSGDNIDYTPAISHRLTKSISVRTLTRLTSAAGNWLPKSICFRDFPKQIKWNWSFRKLLNLALLR